MIQLSVGVPMDYSAIDYHNNGNIQQSSFNQSDIQLVVGCIGLVLLLFAVCCLISMALVSFGAYLRGKRDKKRQNQMKYKAFTYAVNQVMCFLLL